VAGRAECEKGSEEAQVTICPMYKSLFSGNTSNLHYTQKIRLSGVDFSLKKSD